MKKLYLFTCSTLIFPLLAFAFCGYLIPTSKILLNLPSAWHLTQGMQTGIINNTSQTEVLKITVSSNEDAIQISRCNGATPIILAANNSVSCTLKNMQSVEWALAPGRTKGSAGTYMLQQA